MSVGKNKDNSDTPSSEESLRRSEENLASAQRIAHIGSWETDLVNNRLFWSDEVYRIFGVSKDDFGATLEAFINFIHPEDRQAVQDAAAAALSQNAPYNIEHRIITRTGAERIVCEIGEVTFDEAGKPVRMIGTVQDITERKRAERLILESEEKYRNIVETAHEGILLNDLEGRTVFVNRQMPEMLGYTVDDLMNRTIFDFIFEEDFAATKQKIERRRQGEVVTGELRLRRKDGSELICLHKSSPTRNEAGEITGFLTMNTDITERKKAEESIRFQARLLDVVEQAVVATDLDGNVTYWNRFAENLYGWTAAEAVGRDMVELTAPDASREQAVEIIAQLRAGQSWAGEFPAQNKNGETFPSYSSSSPINDKEGKVIGIVGVSVDITARKLAEESLRQAETQYRSLVESSPAIVYLAQPTLPFTPIYISPNITRFGYTAEEWFDGSDMWISLIHPEDRARVLRATEAAMDQGLDTNLEYRAVARDGAIHWLHDKGRFVTDHQGKRLGWQGVILDVTETKGLEEQLRQSQKLESVGRLAGGIAHDFNNMLTAINGYSELTLRSLEAGNPLRQNIEEIKKAGERSALLTHQLLAFSRRQVLRPVVLDLNEVITDTIKLLQRVIGEDVELITALNPKIGRVNVDPGQFSQIIMNLAVNARDAMPHGGQLIIETANIFLEPENAGQKASVLPGAYVMLAVRDTGQGMNEKIQRQIFEPFFTTKELGKGTGLGLATVYGIVKQSGGNIEFDSQVGTGTTFRVYLPRVAGQSETVEKTDSPAEFLSGTEIILLVEDEEPVRNLSREMLEICGYTVIEACDGLEALKIWDAGDRQPDLLMTDVVMPQMGGRELAKKLTEKLPDIKILFTSGYTDDAVIRHGVVETNTNFIQKPFTFDALNRKVRELLDAEDFKVNQ